MTPLVSFLLPAYKGQHLAESIESILKQTFTDFELVIVNDCSPDDIDGIISSYDDYRIRYYRNESNIGGKNLVAQWNRCLDLARGEWTVMASDDDIYDPKFLEELIRLTTKWPSCIVFHSNVKCIDDNGELIKINVPFEEHENMISYAYMHDVLKRWHSMPEWMIRTSDLRKIGGFIDFPTATWSDVATIYVLAQENGIVCCNKPLMSSRNNGKNISFSPNSAIGRALAWEKYSYWCNDFFSKFKVCSNEEKWMITQIINNRPNHYIIRAIINEASIEDIKKLVKKDIWPFTIVSRWDIKKLILEKKRVNFNRSIKLWRKSK